MGNTVYIQSARANESLLSNEVLGEAEARDAESAHAREIKKKKG